MFKKLEIIDLRDNRPKDVAASYTVETGITPEQVKYAAPILAKMVHEAYAFYNTEAPLNVNKPAYLAARVHPVESEMSYDVPLIVTTDYSYKLDT